MTYRKAENVTSEKINVSLNCGWLGYTEFYVGVNKIISVFCV